MPRYYFHLSDTLGVTRDEEGLDLPSTEAARLKAIEAIRDILAEDVAKGRIDLGASLQIADAQGATVLMVGFDEAVMIHHDRLGQP